MTISDHHLKSITGVDAGSHDAPPGGEADKVGGGWVGKLFSAVILALPLTVPMTADGRN